MLDKLYDYQREAVNSALAVNVGTVVLPTGTGKTFCQAAIIASDIIENNSNGIYVINCPRIILSFQLLKEVYFFLVASGIDARYMFVHSGGATDTKEMEEIRIAANEISDDKKVKFAQIESSTSSTEIEGMITKAKSQNLPLIIFSTYHSCPRIEIARKNASATIRMMLNDEAHYLTQEEFHKILSVVESEKRYFFTATARFTPSSEGRGMNNEEKFGNIVYSMTPREAIERGKMVRPRIHTFFSPTVNTFDDFQKSVPKIILEAFIHHSEQIKNQSGEAKILVSTKGVGDIQKFLDSPEYLKLRKSDVDVFAVASSDQVGNRVNDENVSRKAFLKILKEFGEDPSRKIVVLHYDILAEGIDVSGFTGILPLRSLSKSKFLQTFGRAARLHPLDREAFNNGLYKPSDLKKLKKPYAYILAPNIADGNEDDYENICQLIYEMREFDFSCLEHIITSEVKNGIVESEEVNGLNDVNLKLKDIGKIIEKIESDLEAEELASLNSKGKIKRTLRKNRERKAIKAGKIRKVIGYNIYSSLEELKNNEGRVGKYCRTVSKNSRNDIARYVFNRTNPTSLEVYYHVDGPNTFHKESWKKLKDEFPEYIGKYICPIIEYV